MVGDQARVLALRDKYWDLAFELPRPRAPAADEKDRKRMNEIAEELGRLGTDIGPRPADLPPEVELTGTASARWRRGGSRHAEVPGHSRRRGGPQAL